MPGDTIQIRKGKVFVNSRPLDEHTYVINKPHGSYGPLRVRKGYLFVLGDNRDQSNDSRYWGELPVRNVQAKAWLRYWPIGRLAAFK